MNQRDPADKPKAITGQKRERFGSSMPSNVGVIEVSQSLKDFPPEVQAAILDSKLQLEPGDVREGEGIKFAVCTDNTGYPVSLELYKIYPVLQDDVTQDDNLRVVDESGEDYLYPADYFMLVELPPSVENSLLQYVYQTEDPDI